MFDQQNCFTIDNTTPFGYFQSITTEDISANVLDLETTGVDFLNPARPVYLIVKTGPIDHAGGHTSLEIKLINSSVVALSTNEKEIAMWRFLVTQMTANVLLINQALPVGQMEYQYLGLQFTPITGDVTGTAGSLFAALSDSPERSQSHVELVQAAS